MTDLSNLGPAICINCGELLTPDHECMTVEQPVVHISQQEYESADDAARAMAEIAMNSRCEAVTMNAARTMAGHIQRLLQQKHDTQAAVNTLLAVAMRIASDTGTGKAYINAGCRTDLIMAIGAFGNLPQPPGEATEGRAA